MRWHSRTCKVASRFSTPSNSEVGRLAHRCCCCCYSAKKWSRMHCSWRLSRSIFEIPHGASCTDCSRHSWAETKKRLWIGKKIILYYMIYNKWVWNNLLTVAASLWNALVSSFLRWWEARKISRGQSCPSLGALIILRKPASDKNIGIEAEWHFLYWW